MLTVTPHFITDSTGKKISVILPIAEFEQMMEELEDLHDIELYDEATAANEPPIPIDEAFQMIGANVRIKDSGLSNFY